MENRSGYIKDVHRIVIKVGTSTLAHSTGLLSFTRMEHIVRQLADLHNRGYEIVLVTSGAIAAGIGKLGLKSKPKSIPEKQAAAAVGQGILLHMYEKFFSDYGQVIAQILLTKEDMDHPERRSNAQNTLFSLLNQGVIPIINENDAIAVDEIKFGDNDTLSAVVSKITNADLLIILSDIDGLFDSNPRENPDAKLIHEVDKITDEIEYSAGGSGTKLGTGGMITKICAAKIATAAGTSMVIANGSISQVIVKIMDGETLGTWFKSSK